MNVQIIKKVILEKQAEIPTYALTHRDITFGDQSNYVLVGLRRAGKSYLLYQDIQSRIVAGGVTAQDILYVNFEDERLAYIAASELGTILDAYQELYPGRKPWVYLDEIQNVQGWEKFARRLADSQYRVMITGSNARMLSREMASTLGGRYIPREVFPFSFGEYLSYHGVVLGLNWEFDPVQKPLVVKHFEAYFHEGGIAESFVQADKREYLNALYQKILIGDIVERNGIRNPRVFRFLAKKLADSVMQPTSVSRMQHLVTSTGDSISLPVLKDYLCYMQDAYLTFAIPNLASPLTAQATTQKRYLVDNGILNLFLYQGETKLLENVVAIDLDRRYRNTLEETMLYYYNKGVEVDFCIPSAHLAVQVSYSLDGDETREREVGALLRFMQAYPGWRGVIVTCNEDGEIEREGHHVAVVPVWRWLLRP